jgi:ADP-heptose:LPS heptosyltransferase
VTENAKILIIRLSSIGDIIHCSGVPRNLKKRFPEAEIHWLVRSDNSELLKFNPQINKIISFNQRDGFLGWIKLSLELRKYPYTHVYDAHNNLRSRILSLLLKAPHFVRRSKRRLKRFLLFWFKIDTFEKPYISTESYVTPIANWGVLSDKAGPELFLAPEILKAAKMFFPGIGPWLAIAPATAWKKKNWPEFRWKELISQILSQTKFQIIILGGPKDKFCENLILDRKRVLSLQGKLSLLESAAMASLCETLIVGDTGLLHMTEALGKNVIGLFGPTPFGHPTRMGSQVLETKLWCKPCSKDGSGPCINPTFQKCMKEITPQAVFESLNKVTRASAL